MPPRPLRSSLIRLASKRADLRPHILPLLRSASDDLSPEEEAVALWHHIYEARYRAVLKTWEARYDRDVDTVSEVVAQELKAFIRYWFYERKGNFHDTPGEEAPNFKGAKDALFHRRRKMDVELRDLKAKLTAMVNALTFADDAFLNTLDAEIDKFSAAYSER